MGQTHVRTGNGCVCLLLMLHTTPGCISSPRLDSASGTHCVLELPSRLQAQNTFLPLGMKKAPSSPGTASLSIQFQASPSLKLEPDHLHPQERRRQWVERLGVQALESLDPSSSPCSDCGFQVTDSAFSSLCCLGFHMGTEDNEEPSCHGCGVRHRHPATAFSVGASPGPPRWLQV